MNKNVKNENICENENLSIDKKKKISISIFKLIKRRKYFILTICM